MRFSDYLLNKLSSIALNVLGCFVLSAFLLLIEVDLFFVCVIIITWFIIYVLWLVINYYKYKKQQADFTALLKDVDKKYLMMELIDEPEEYGQKLFYHLFKEGFRSMNEEIAKIRRERKEYQEYIEQWVHEIKTPISAIELVCTNNKPNALDVVSDEVFKIEQLVDQTLYYARSSNVEKDFFIHKVALDDLIHPSLFKFRSLLLDKQFSIDISVDEDFVYTDEKWVRFILDQIITNAIKYCKKDQNYLGISTKNIKNGIALIIEDHGIGIDENDLSRIYEKGFTGKNRLNHKSTGIGLYLSKVLCDKLGVMIEISSEESKYTKVSLYFPKGTLNRWED